MPSANPAPKKPPVSAKGKPLGIPMWGWFAAAAVGILIGYTLLRKSSGSLAGGTTPDQSFSPSADPGSGSPSGTVTIPGVPDALQALGLTPGSGSSPASVQNNPNDVFESSATQEANSAAIAPSTSDPILQALVNQGVTTAPAGTTVDFGGTTYDVSGKPEFSPGNFNPNSPAGVLAMNQAIESVPMPGSTPLPTPDVIAPGNTNPNSPAGVLAFNQAAAGGSPAAPAAPTPTPSPPSMIAAHFAAGRDPQE